MQQLAFLFPGQGAQSVGMAKDLYDQMPEVQNLFQKAEEILGYDLKAVCFEGPQDKLDSTVFSQPALYVCSMAALEMLKSEQPDAVNNVAAVAGLSLGEYTAIAFAGGFSFEDGLRLVQQRGQAMQDAADKVASGMVSVLGLEKEQVLEVCEAARIDDEVLVPANYLCPGNIAVSGQIASCGQVNEIAMEKGAMKTVPLAVAGAFHSAIMQPAVERLTEALSQVEMSSTRIPVYCNVDAQPHTKPGELKTLLIDQVCSPVKWHDSMQKMIDDGYGKFYEVGPGRVLRGLMKRISRKMPCEGTLN